MIFFLRLSHKLLRMNHWFLAGFTVLFIAASSTLAYLLEPGTYETWFNAFWWTMTTMTTVGYGDYFPVTTAGKLFAIVLYLFGIGLLSLVIGKIIEAFGTVKKRRESGLMSYVGKNHLILIGWSRKANAAMEEILHSEPEMDIVIVDVLDHAPVELDRVHYVSGDPSAEKTLAMAGLTRARAVILFADRTIDDPALSDGKSLLVASSVERLAPHVHTTVEIVMEQHIDNFRHVQVNEFVLSHEAVSRLAVRSALQAGASGIFRQLLSRRFGEDIYEVAAAREWRTYGDAFSGLLAFGATLIADRDDMTINRKLEQPIPDDARLFVICDAETRAKLPRARS